MKTTSPQSAGWLLTVAWLLAAPSFAQQTAPSLDRTVLPIQLPKRPVITELDARKVKLPPRIEPTAPKGAPNVMIVLLDDLGFGATSPFGGPVPTPAIDRLARSGLRDNNVHTTTRCSPRRAALDKVGEGQIQHAQAAVFSADETADVGIVSGTPVVETIGSEAKSKFPGKIPKLTSEVKPVPAPAGAE